MDLIKEEADKDQEEMIIGAMEVCNIFLLIEISLNIKQCREHCFIINKFDGLLYIGLILNSIDFIMNYFRRLWKQSRRLEQFQSLGQQPR